MIRKNLGKYRVESWIGGGQFADVFLVFDTITEKKFALKVSRTRERDIEMLKREAQLLASLEHPNIVRFYTAELIEGKLAIVMEYVDGQSLRDVIENEAPIDETRAISIINDVLEALSYAHSRGVLHRDIKPENIMITKDGEVKLTDFGLAVILSSSLSFSMAGTPIYMAPEAWSGKMRKESDIWSVACVLYELIAGYPPFFAETIEDLRNQIFKGKLKKPARMTPQLFEIIKKALRKVPSERYRTASEMKQALQDYVRKGGGELSLKTVHVRKKSSPILEGLTEEQREAVVNGDGYFLLIGGAGTGKTTTLVHRIAYLIHEKGVPPENILAVTFTGKAAGEMKDRVEKLIGEGNTKNLWTGTFHYLGRKIVSYGIERLGYPPEFQLITRDAQEELFEKATGIRSKEKARAILREISRYKGNLISPEYLLEHVKHKWRREVAEAYEKYQKELFFNGFIDLDDLIFLSVRLLRQYDDIKELFSERFRYILVDEFQDINRGQFVLMQILSSRHKNLFVTGDDDQSIYGFRGASSKFLMDFRKYYPDHREVRLTQNFRSPDEILNVANTLISHNEDRIDKLVIPLRESGQESIKFYAARNEIDEAEFVAEKILEERERGRSFDDIAVLIRLNSLSRPFEEVFSKKKIPFNVLGIGGFYEREEIKASIGFLKFLTGKGSASDLQSMLIKFLRWHPKDAKTAVRYFSKTGKPTFSKKFTEEQLKTLERFWEYLNSFTPEQLRVRSPQELLEEVYDVTGYMKYLEEKDTPSRLVEKDNINELLGIAGSFKKGEVREFLSHVAMMQHLGEEFRSVGGVQIITIHQAKGLEFPVVFLVGLVEGVFPLFRSVAEKSGLEEERRLCYVALTRASETLYLTYPKKRFRYYQEPSRFLYEMYVREERNT